MPIATPQGTLDFKSVDKVTFVGASSNTVIDTTTGSLGVGVGVGGPTSNLHVVGNTHLEGDINMLHTANTASIKLNSNVVTEFPRSKKLIKYPRVNLNSASQDGYVVTASTDGYVSTKFHRYDPFRPFVSGTGTNSANGWHSGPPDSTNPTTTWNQTFNTSGYYDKDVTSYGAGGYAGTSIAGIESEWLKLELPHKIILSHLYYQQRDGQSINYSQAPRDFRILGSNDDANWDTIRTFTNQDSVAEGQTVVAEADKGYKYLAFVVTRVWGEGSNRHLTIKNIEYYGVPEYDPAAYGTDVVIKSVPNVPNTDWLDIYYDGQDYTSMQSTVDNKTGVSTYDATPINGVGFDATQKAFTFDANSNQYLSTSTPISGNYVHSISIWFKGTNLTPTQGDTIMWVGDNTNNKRIEIYIENDRINYNFKENDCIAHVNLENDRWYHLTCTYNGEQGGNGRDIYLDGQRLSTSHSGNSADLNITNSTLNVGGFSGTTPTYQFSGFIANFRLFNRVLSTDEIYQLYAYQKEDFGHGDLSMTLKAGRLGIGTSEPKAVLDVRGVGRFKHANDPGDSDLLDVHGAIRVTGESPDYLRIRLGNYFSVGEATGVAVPETLEAGRPLTDNPGAGSAIIEYTGGESDTTNEGAHIWLNGDTIGIMNTGDRGTLHWYDSDMPSAHTTSGRHWQISTSGGIANTSDLTLKNNIRYFDDEYNTSDSMLKYSQIKFCKYNWKKELKDPSGVKEDFYGVIAQEIEPLFPEMIQADAAGLKMLKQERLQYISYHMIANLIQKNADLEARISALENA